VITVNTKHDTDAYERACNGRNGYQRDIFNGNSLYDAFRRAEKGSDWKPQVQKFEMTYLLSLSEMQKQLMNRKYEFLPASEFIIHERGKTRVIRGEQIQDRIVKHALCDEVLNPVMRKYLIYDNGASLVGKGIDFTRKRLLRHLHRFYMLNGSNEGHIALFDFSKYYDNLLHSVLKDLFRTYVEDETALWLLDKTIDRSRVDVSYMDEYEYEHCLNALFNSLEYEKIDKRLLTGEKFMGKHLYVGDQVAQTAGISYPIPVDNYIKIARGEPFYGRYMDDGYVIHKSHEHLEELLADVTEVAASVGITINEKKTHIYKLSELWRFLQIQYSLTDTGRVIQKINPKRLTVMRRKMKKLAPRMTTEDFTNWFNAWFDNHYKIMSNKQKENMKELFSQLKEVTL